MVEKSTSEILVILRHGHRKKKKKRQAQKDMKRQLIIDKKNG